MAARGDRVEYYTRQGHQQASSQYEVCATEASSSSCPLRQAWARRSLSYFRREAYHVSFEGLTCHSTDNRQTRFSGRDEHLQLARDNARYGEAGMHAIGWRTMLPAKLFV